MTTVLALVGYGIATILVLFLGGSEALGTTFGVAIILSPVILILGVVLGFSLSKTKSSNAGTAAFAMGFAFPLLAFFVIGAGDSISRTTRQTSHLREAREGLEKAKADGFPFPPSVAAFTHGEASTNLSVREAIAFYDSATAGIWKSHKAGNSAWYVRLSKNDMTDRIVIRSANGRASIYFGQVDRTQLQIGVASAFSGACSSSQWAVAKAWCSPKFRASLADNGLQARLGNVRPSSPAFLRPHHPNSKAQIAVNGQLNMGRRGFRTVEIGFAFTDDPIPLIEKVEL